MHLYELRKDSNYFGFTEDTINDENIKIKFILVENIEDNMLRKQEEKRLIQLIKPMTQSGKSDYQKGVEDRIKALTTFLNAE